MISGSLRAWMDEIEEAATNRGYEAAMNDCQRTLNEAEEAAVARGYAAGMRDCATDHRQMIRHARAAGAEDRYGGIQRARWQGAWGSLVACLGLLVVAGVLRRRR
jgi:hypothetical protein